ncbi:MAG TPA: protein kinase [Kofleriaceae bacterium]|nr:protein kinase [Kofleriaceae bacterium]
MFRGRFVRCPRDGAQLESAAIDPLVGSTLVERYAIEELLGEGGMGRVYRARHMRMSRRFAVKVLFGDLAGDPKVIARFSREAEAASRLGHPHVVGVVDFGETPEGLLYLAMDYADGPSLGSLIDQIGPLPSARARLIAEQIADGLDHAHKRNLVHRDLKPDNVVIERTETGDHARILDFGIAVLRDEHEATRERLTTDGLVVGTPHYMAPEQAMNEPIDHRIDLFALGVIIYEMLAGMLPFDGAPAEVARAHITRTPPRVNKRNPGVVPDPLLEALAFRLMAKRPSERPEHAKDVVMCLRAISNDRAAAAKWLRVDDSPNDPGIRPPTPQAQAAEQSRALYQAMEARGTLPMQASRPEVYATGATDQIEAPPKRRGAMLAIGAAVLLVGGGGVFLATRGGAAAPVIDAQVAIVTPPPPVVIDAGVVAIVEPPDAAPVVAAPVDAGVKVVTNHHVDHPRVPQGSGSASGSGSGSAVHVASGSGSGSGSGSTTVAVLDPVTDTASLTKRYKAVGHSIDALIAARGENVGEPLKQRYLAIPYVDALRDPSLRTSVANQLAKLAHDVAAQQK